MNGRTLSDADVRAIARAVVDEIEARQVERDREQVAADEQSEVPPEVMADVRETIRCLQLGLPPPKTPRSRVHRNERKRR